MLDWRALYQWREDQYEEKLRASGERLRQRTAAESSGRDSRSIQVLHSSSGHPRRVTNLICASCTPAWVYKLIMSLLQLHGRLARVRTCTVC